jgi:outer membrane beta-barrel protein
MPRHVPAQTIVLSLVAAALTAAELPAAAADAPAQNEQVIVPQVERRDVPLPRFPSKDFEAALFTGVYQTENFGSGLVYGVKLGYHISEDFFVQGAFAATKVSDEAFRQILPGGVFAKKEEPLSYYNLSVGYNVLPGEVFFGNKVAKASAVYVIGGVGSTRFNEQTSQTINFGGGMRLILRDWAAVQVDVRDHVFSIDLLGKKQSTNNLELTAGASFFF